MQRRGGALRDGENAILYALESLRSRENEPLLEVEQVSQEDDPLQRNRLGLLVVYQ